MTVVWSKQEVFALSRFLDNVDKTSTCWNWTGTTNNSGYGSFYFNKEVWFSHRFSYTYLIGCIPNGLRVLHKCDNPKCVNPNHLFLGTQKENLQDMYRKGRQRKIDTYKSGEEHCNAKLSTTQVKEIRKLYSTTRISWRELAQRYNISKRCIGRIIHLETYKNAQ